MNAEETRYSEKIKGTPRNHDFAQKFDVSGDGFLGIQQYDGETATDRVLLSPRQVNALLAFLEEQ